MSGSNKSGPQKPATAPSGGLSNISEETLRKMLEVQGQKIQLELRQTEIAIKELEHNQKIADKSIDAQTSDRQDERRTNVLMHRNGLVFAGCAILGVIVLMVAALSYGKDALALDVIKVLCGFAGGWGVSKVTQKRHHGNHDDE